MPRSKSNQTATRSTPKATLNPDRFLLITTWAARRYTLNGVLPLQHGASPSRFTQIENAAWSRYMDGMPG